MANSTTLTGSAISTAVASDPELCRISGYLKNAFGQPLAGWHFVLRYCYIPLGSSTDTLVMQERYPIRADRNGYVEFDAVRGAQFTLELPNQAPWLYKELVVPDASSAGLLGVLLPYIVSVDFADPSAEAIAVGESVSSLVEATLSNGEVVELPTAAVTVESSDDAVLASAAPGLYRGLSVGAATLTVTAVDAEEAGLNQDREGNNLVFFSPPSITLPVSPKSVTVS